MHLDIAGVMEMKSEVPYLPAGMAGKSLKTFKLIRSVTLIYCIFPHR